MSLELRRRLMATKFDPIIIDARYGGVSGNPDNDAALMNVIYAQKWSKSPLYMTKREAESVTSIPGRLFYGNVQIGNFDAFEYFTSLTRIPRYMFYQSKLNSIVIPNNIIYIGDSNDSYSLSQTKLIRIVIPDSVTLIGASAFNGGIFELIDIGKGVQEIYSQAFAAIKTDVKIIIRAISPPKLLGIYHFLSTPSYTIYVPNESIEAYKAADVWSASADKIKPLSEYTE